MVQSVGATRAPLMADNRYRARYSADRRSPDRLPTASLEPIAIQHFETMISDIPIASIAKVASERSRKEGIHVSGGIENVRSKVHQEFSIAIAKLRHCGFALPSTVVRDTQVIGMMCPRWGSDH